MKTKYIISLLFLYLSVEANVYAGNIVPVTTSCLYGNVIYTSELKDDVLAKSIADMQKFLQQSTGQAFSKKSFVSMADECGIYLLLNNQKAPISSSNLKKLNQGSIEDFVISATSKKLIIVGSHPLGLSRGIYSYLDMLGFKWYFPGDLWSTVPALKDITIREDKYITPTFSLRGFFGTGGLYSVPSINEDEVIKDNWEDWKRRNRMGGSVVLWGHYWETFNLKYQKELKEHPEYLAEIKGSRVGWHVSSKFCISNKDLQQLFIKDRVDELKVQLSKSEYPSEKIIIPIDPSDGGGHCECSECKKIGTVSDRVFLLANLVAKEVAKISHRAFVNLYAYNEHAAPPAKELEPNVIVQIIPYAFQSVGTPEQMITLWKKKSKNLFLYDYYGIPDWHFETPLTGRWSVYDLIKKLSFWKKTDIKGVLFESSNGIGTTGLGLYLAGRAGWDGSEDLDKTIALFYENMFGKGKTFIKKYYDKISFGFKEIADIPYLYDALDKTIQSAAGNNNVRTRVELLKGYVHYAVLNYQYKSSADKMNDGSWERVMKYAWEIYPTMMIHSTRIAELLLQQSAGGSKELIDRWAIYSSTASGIKNMKWISNSTINQYAEADKKKYPLLKDFAYEDESSKYKFTVKKGIPVKDNAKEMMVLDFPDMFFKTSAAGIFKLSMQSSTLKEQDIVMSIIDTATGNVILEQKEHITENWKEYTIKQKPQKIYQLYIKKEGWLKISIKDSEFFYITKVPTYTYLGKLWFYVPAGKSFVYYKNSGKDHPIFFNTSGIVVQAKKINDEGIFQVPVGDKNGWWSVEKTELKFLEFYLQPMRLLPHPNFDVTK